MERLKIDKLSFSYGKVKALNDINFSCDDGKLIAVLGKNGAGKSTLFKCMLGILKGYEGAIYLDGNEVSGMKASDLAKCISYIPQAHSPVFNYTVRDVIIMGRVSYLPFYSSPGEMEYAESERIMKMIGIAHLASRGYREISGGERQLVLIARALMQGSNIMIMDEPTANLDYGNQIKVLEYAKELASKGYLILLSTHNPEHAISYSDEAVIINEKKILAKGAAEEVLNSDTLTKVYGVNLDIVKVSIGGKQVKLIAHF